SPPKAARAATLEEAMEGGDRAKSTQSGETGARGPSGVPARVGDQSRRAVRRIFPRSLLGKLSRKTTWRGYFQGWMRAFTNSWSSRESAAERVTPRRTTT